MSAMLNITVAFRGIPQSPGWETGSALIKAFRKLGHQVYPYGRYFQTREPIYKIPKYIDLLVYLEMNDPDPQYLELEPQECIKIYWEFDTSMHWDWSQQWYAGWKWDKIFLANPTFLAKVPNSQYLPYAVDTEHFYPNDNIKKEGAAIIGHPFKERLDFAKAAKIDVITNVYRDDYVKELQKLKISVHNYASGGNGLIVMRPFETMGCKTCLLAEKDETLEKHFENGTHLVLYDSPDDCREKVKELLQNDAKREAIAEQGYKEVLKKHTYMERARAILAAIQ
jgi:spore maturation protein CgeB